MQITLSLVYKYLTVDNELDRPIFAKDLLCDHCSLDLSDRVFVQQCVRILERELLIKQTYQSLNDFFTHYSLQIGSSFVATLLGYFFLMVDWTWYVKESRLLFEHLPLMLPEIASEILSRIISREDIPLKSRNFLFRRIDQVFVNDHLQSQVWQLLDPTLKQRYLHWNIEDKINLHCLNNSLKRGFLLSYLNEMLDAAQISQEILALRFADFVLIDDVNQPKRLLYYDKATMRHLLEKGLPEIYLSNPPVGVRLAMDAYSNQSEMKQHRKITGIVEITLDTGNLKSSQLFMDYVLQRPKTQQQKAAKQVLTTWVHDETNLPKHN